MSTDEDFDGGGRCAVGSVEQTRNRRFAWHRQQRQNRTIREPNDVDRSNANLNRKAKSTSQPNETSALLPNQDDGRIEERSRHSAVSLIGQRMSSQPSLHLDSCRDAGNRPSH